MEGLKEESEYVKIQLEDDVNTDVENILKISYNILVLPITYEEYKNILLNITKNYKNIEYTEKNIMTYITIVDYFMLNKQEEIFNHIIEKYIIRENKYYEKLNVYNSIDYYIRKKLGTTNEINSETLEYIININSEITELYSCLITQETLNKCKSLVKLNINGNKNIKNVNHLNKLEELNISWSCEINQEGINELKLRSCGVNQEGINELKLLKTFNACGNNKITNVNHLDKLEELDVSWRCGVNQNGIKNLKLVKNLNARNNINIKDVNYLEKIEELNISGETCGVDQEGIKDLKLVKNLNAYNNNKIKDVNHLEKLKILNISGEICGVDQEGIKDLKLVKNLDACKNNKIKDVNHLYKLEELNISWNCGVNQEGIKDLKLVKNLDAYNNNKIKDVNHLEKLEILDISGRYCEVDQE